MGHRPGHDRPLVHALRLHMQGGQLAHFAGADHQYDASLEIAENLLRQRHRGETDRHGARAEPRFSADAFADRKGKMEQAIEQRADDVRGASDRVGVFDLTKDLRLADDQRIETGCDAEEMSGDIEIREMVDMRLERLAIEAVELGDEVHRRGPSALQLVAHSVQFRAVAGRENHRFAQRGLRRQCPESGLEPAGLKVDAFTQLDRRGSMADSDQYQVQNP